MKKLPGASSIIQSLSEAKGVVFFIPENPCLDLVAASLSLFLSLKKSGKEASLACSSPMTVGFSRLIGVDKISTKIGGRSLVVSFDYSENAIDKVSYNIGNKRFNLVVQPKPGSSPLSAENVEYSHSGGFGLAVVIGAESLDNLGSIYRQETDFFNRTSLLNMDINPSNSRFGKVKAIFSTAGSYSEVMAALLEEANYPVDPDIASNLLLGIQEATNNFISAKAGPLAFEAAAFCLRNGARRRAKDKSSISLKTMSENDSAARFPKEDKASPSPDWYGPKVFRGTKQA